MGMRAEVGEQVLLGVDFSSSPSRRKTIAIASGVAVGDQVLPQRIEHHASLESFAQALDRPGPWLGAFDLPFGLPRELVQQLGWPLEWPALIDHFASLPRPAIRDLFAAFCAARPAGAKFAHRECDRPAGSSPAMKWVNPPVAWMLHAGVPLLIAAGLRIPRLRDDGDASRIAVEAYPGLLARAAIGKRSYKSDDRQRQTPQREQARADIVTALERGDIGGLGLRLVVDAVMRRALIADASGDTLDAVLCLVQAAFASRRADFGLPETVDAIEGWIVGAGLIASSQQSLSAPAWARTLHAQSGADSR
jgi:hypothetical protein